jgi:hypothetical protein
VVEFIHSRHFSLDGARRTLLEISPLVSELVSLKQKLDELGYDIHQHQYFGGSGPNGQGAYPAEVVRLVEIAQALEGRGVLIKDLDRGLIDFPYIREDGEEVYLCWMVGEEEIRFWHRIPDGFAGRKPISEL